MAMTRDKLLTTRDDYGNTLLHAAIVANDTELALKYIQEDMAAKDGQTIINVKSMNNTPLILALKKGNIAVADALLKHPDVDVFASDGRGLTALHWACMLRQDHLIESLMSKGANPHLAAPKWIKNPVVSEAEMTPIKLYENIVLLSDFTSYAKGADAAIYLSLQDAMNEQERDSIFKIVSHLFNHSIYYAVFNREKQARPPYADRSDLYIPGSMAYTDVIFHMSDICTNMHWASPNTKFVKAISEAETFRQNFVAGMKDFCDNRNMIPVNANLLTKMKEFKPVAMERKVVASPVNVTQTKVGVFKPEVKAAPNTPSKPNTEVKTTRKGSVG